MGEFLLFVSGGAFAVTALFVVAVLSDSATHKALVFIDKARAGFNKIKGR